MDLNNAQDEFELLVSKVGSSDLANFFHWIQAKYLTSECLGEKPAIAYSTLNSIANDIKLLVPKTGLMSSESINYPSVGEVLEKYFAFLKSYFLHKSLIMGLNTGVSPVFPFSANSDCDQNNTVSVDAFLYDDMDIEELVKNGDLLQNFCLDCNSRNIKPFHFISHSASKQRISFIFNGFLKKFDFSNKIVLDVGSRLGAILYGAYVNTNASKIIGIEINAELCSLQNTIVDKYKMNDRIEIKCGDVCSFPKLINSSDLIILNNVFEFFQSPSKQVECWLFLYKNIKSGTVLVTVPSLEDSLKNVSETQIDLSKWVSREEVRDPLLAMSIQDLEELSEVCVYRVI